MPSMFEQVKEFQRDVVKYPLPAGVELTNQEITEGQLKHVIEEVQEIQHALWCANIVGAADGIADAIYVLLGIAARMGLPMDEIFTAVHNANMRKVAGRTKRDIDYDAVKPEGWVPPETEIAFLVALKITSSN